MNSTVAQGSAADGLGSPRWIVKSGWTHLIEVGRKSRYWVVRIADRAPRRIAIGSLAVDEPAYLHAFSATALYRRGGISVRDWSARSAPVFVACPDGIDGDDGVLLAVVLDAATSSYLLVLEARTREECVRALVPHCVPFGFLRVAWATRGAGVRQ